MRGRLPAWLVAGLALGVLSPVTGAAYPTAGHAAAFVPVGLVPSLPRESGRVSASPDARLAELLARGDGSFSGSGTAEDPYRPESPRAFRAWLRERDLPVVGEAYATPDRVSLQLLVWVRESADARPREYVADLTPFALAATRALAAGGLNDYPDNRDVVTWLAAAGDRAARAGLATELGADAVLSRSGAFQAAVAEARAGNLGARLALGAALSGHAHPEVARVGLRWLEGAAEQGVTGAQLRLGLLRLDSEPATARVWLARAADGGDAEAMRVLAALHLSGEHWPVDRERGFELLEARARLGDPDHLADLAAIALTEQRALPEDLEQRLEGAAAEGHPRACAVLADHLARGVHWEQDLDRARDLWRAAGRSSADPDLLLAIAEVLLRNTLPVLHDPQEARRWLDKARELRPGLSYTARYRQLEDLLPPPGAATMAAR